MHNMYSLKDDGQLTNESSKYNIIIGMYLTISLVAAARGTD